MKKIYELENLEEILHVFSDMRNEKDDFPFVGSGATLRIMNGKIFISAPNSNAEFLVSDDVDSDQLLMAIAGKSKINLVFNI